jgi:hypothetical protein
VTALVAAAALYVAAYAAAEAWHRRDRGRVLILCPLRDAGCVPSEIVERLGPPAPAGAVDTTGPVEFTIAFSGDAPGISLTAVTGASSLDARVGPYIRGIFTPARDHWLGLLERPRRWTAGLLYDLALEVLHTEKPRSLIVDLRPPPPDRARELGVSPAETDLDIAMYAYEIRCRIRRYSRYRDTPCELLFCGADATWRLTG